MAFDLVARLTLDDQFSGKLSKATKGMERTDKAIGGMATGVKNFITTAAGISAAIGLTAGLSKAFDMIKDSIGSAFDRIDTMESFERVMTTLTGSTEKTNAALEATRDAVTGTAFGLDVAAKGVQDFVTRGMEVEKATDTMAAWGDAVAFYGDGSNEQLASVTDAMAKMLSSGKVSMQHMDAIYNAGIDAPGMFAKAVGKTEEDVKAALSSGEISTEEFIDVVSTAMMEGTNGVENIAGAAQEAGASWGAAFDNMKAAVTRGVVTIIETIDEMLEENGLPDMRTMIADFGDKFEEILGKAAEAIPPVIEKMKEIYENAKEWFPAVREAVIGITTAFIAFKGIMVTMTVIGTVTRLIEAMRKGTLLATLAQMGFNTAMLANPMTWVVAGIALLVAAGVLLYRNWDVVKEKALELWDTIIDLKDKGIAKLTEVFEENEVAIKTVATILGVVFGPALLKVAAQAIVTAAVLTGRFIASMILAGARAIATAAIISVQLVGALIRMSAQAVMTAATMTVSVIAALVRFATQGWKTVAAIAASTTAWIVQRGAMIAGAAVMGIMTAAQWALNVALNANPIGLIVLAIAALVGIGVLLYKNWDKIKSKAVELWDRLGKFKIAAIALLGPFGTIIAAGVLLYKNWDIIKERAVSLWTTMKEVFGNIGPWISETWDKVKEATSNAVTTMGELISEFAGNVKQLFIDRFNQALDFVIWVFTEMPLEILYGLAYAARITVDWLMEIAASFGVWFGQALENAVTFLIELPEKIGEWLTIAWEASVEWLTEIAVSFGVWFGNAVTSAVTFLAELPGKIGEWLLNAWETSVEWLSGIASDFGAWFATAITNAGTFLAELPGKVAGYLSDARDDAVVKLEEIAGKFTTWFTTARDNALEKVKELPGKIAGFIADIPGRIGGAIDDVKSKFAELGAAIPNAIADGFNAAKDKLGGAANWAVDKAVGGLDGLKTAGSNAWSAVSGGWKAAGSHYHGIDRIPMDGYMAELHRGERILTRQEADNYDQFNSMNKLTNIATAPNVDLRMPDISNIIDFPTPDSKKQMDHVSYDETSITNNYRYDTVNNTYNPQNNAGEGGGKGETSIVINMSDTVIREDADVGKVAHDLARLIEREGVQMVR